MSAELDDNEARIDRLRERVNEDHERIGAAGDPFAVLNLEPGSSWEEAAARYERYERFYRAENFQRLGDMDLTRKALDVRRAVGRAIVEIQGMIDELTDAAEPPSITDLDPDARALGDIYYRDGLTYLRLGDLRMSVECLRRSTEYDPGRGISLAYLAYAAYRQRPQDDDTIDECRRNMSRALRMESDNVDVHVLAARFFLKVREVEVAVESIERVRELDPGHPKLSALEDRLRRARA